MSKNRKAVVVDVNDPDKRGRVKIRVSGVHKPKKYLPDDKLPWTVVQQATGSGQGVGGSINLTVGHWVEVQPMNAAQSVWKIVANASVTPEKAKDKENSLEAEPKNEEQEKDTLSDYIVPTISGLTALVGSIHEIVNSDLLEFVSDDSGAPGTTPPISANPVDWTIPEKQVYRPTGADLGNWNDHVKIDGRAFSQKYATIEILQGPNGKGPGDIQGLDRDGEIVYATFENYNLHIPPLVTAGTYTIDYRATLKSDGTFEDSTVTIKVYANVPDPSAAPTTKTRSQPKDKDFAKVSVKEPESNIDKSEYPYTKTYQSPNNLITTREDYTVGNSTYSVTQLDDKDDASTLSRFEMRKEGTILKSSSDIIMISRQDLKMYIDGVVEQAVQSRFTLNCPTIELKGDILIKGNLTIEGDIDHTGTQTTSVDVIADGISLVRHTHKQPHAKNQENKDEPTAPPTP